MKDCKKVGESKCKKSRANAKEPKHATLRNKGKKPSWMRSKVNRLKPKRKRPHGNTVGSEHM